MNVISQSVYLYCIWKKEYVCEIEKWKPTIVHSSWLKPKGFNHKKGKQNDRVFQNRTKKKKNNKPERINQTKRTHNASCYTISTIYTAKFTNGLWNDATPHVV